jgi:K+-sensing histidine kinase KdpD
MNSNPFNTLSNEELDQNLRALQQKPQDMAEVDRLQQLLQELQVHQIELEMHNRALRDSQVELEASVNRYADLYENLPIAYLTIKGNGQISAANRAANEWLNPDKRGVVGQFIGKYFDAYDAGRLAAHIEMCLRHRQPSSVELMLRPPHKDPIAVQINSRCCAPHVGDPVEVHLSLTDISGLKQSQKMLMEINREQESFNYSISHDLRAPLVTINNYAGVVLSDFAAQLGPEGVSMMERIRAASVRMESTLKHLLKYSTLAREEITLGPVNTDELVKGLLVEYRGFLQEKQAMVSVDPLPAVRGCAPLLHQVLANLLTNAVKYAREGEPPQVRIHAETQTNTVVLKVTDTGIGIDRKDHERVFRIFERLHGYSKYPGSGIGLAIARRAVERMNGTIWVESELGKGSTFCVKLPKE